jgi:hypothetical protein
VRETLVGYASLALSIQLCAVIYLSVRNSDTWFGRRWYARADYPRLYWVIVAFYCALLMLAIALGVFRTPISESVSRVMAEVPVILRMIWYI